MATAGKEVAAIDIQQKDVKPKTSAEEIIDLLIDKIKVVSPERFAILHLYGEVINYVLSNYYNETLSKEDITNYINKIEQHFKDNNNQIDYIDLLFKILYKVENNANFDDLIVKKSSYMDTFLFDSDSDIDIIRLKNTKGLKYIKTNIFDIISNFIKKKVVNNSNFRDTILSFDNKKIKFLLVGNLTSGLPDDIITYLHLKIPIDINYMTKLKFRDHKHYIIYFLKIVPYIILLNNYKLYENKKDEFAKKIINFKYKLTFPSSELKKDSQNNIIKEFRVAGKQAHYFNLNKILYDSEYFVVDTLYHTEKGTEVIANADTTAKIVWEKYDDCKKSYISNDLSYAKVFYITIYLNTYLSLWLSKYDDKGKEKEFEGFYIKNKELIKKYNAVIDDMLSDNEGNMEHRVKLSESNNYLEEYKNSRKANQDIIQTKIEELKTNKIITEKPYTETVNNEEGYKLHSKNVGNFKKIIEDIMSNFANLSAIDTKTQHPLVDNLAEIVEKISNFFNVQYLVSLYEKELSLTDKDNSAIITILEGGIQKYNTETQDNSRKIQIFIDTIEKINSELIIFKIKQSVAETKISAEAAAKIADDLTKKLENLNSIDSIEGKKYNIKKYRNKFNTLVLGLNELDDNADEEKIKKTAADALVKIRELKKKAENAKNNALKEEKNAANADKQDKQEIKKKVDECAKNAKEAKDNLEEIQTNFEVLMTNFMKYVLDNITVKEINKYITLFENYVDKVIKYAEDKLVEVSKSVNNLLQDNIKTGLYADVNRISNSIAEINLKINNALHAVIDINITAYKLQTTKDNDTAARKEEEEARKKAAAEAQQLSQQETSPSPLQATPQPSLQSPLQATPQPPPQQQQQSQQQSQQQQQQQAPPSPQAAPQAAAPPPAEEKNALLDGVLNLLPNIVVADNANANNDKPLLNKSLDLLENVLDKKEDPEKDRLLNESSKLLSGLLNVNEIDQQTAAKAANDRLLNEGLTILPELLNADESANDRLLNKGLGILPNLLNADEAANDRLLNEGLGILPELLNADKATSQPADKAANDKLLNESLVILPKLLKVDKAEPEPDPAPPPKPEDPKPEDPKPEAPEAAIQGNEGNHNGFNEQAVRDKYLYSQRYKNVGKIDLEMMRDKARSFKGQPAPPGNSNKIAQLSSYIDIYYRNKVNQSQNSHNDDKDMINRIKIFENDPRNPLEALELTFEDRIIFIIITFFIRYAAISIIQRGIDINLISSFYEGFIYYGCIYIIFFWFIVFFVNIDNNYAVNYLNINDLMNYIRSLFYYFYMGTNGITRLIIHSLLMIIIIIIPIILNIKNETPRDPINDEQADNNMKTPMTLEERIRLSKLLSIFTLFIWILTSIIATKF